MSTFTFLFIITVLFCVAFYWVWCQVGSMNHYHTTKLDDATARAMGWQQTDYDSYFLELVDAPYTHVVIVHTGRGWDAYYRRSVRGLVQNTQYIGEDFYSAWQASQAVQSSLRRREIVPRVGTCRG